MADDLQLKVDTRECEERLEQLPPTVANRYMKKALRAGGDVVLARMKAICPERTDEPTPNEDSLPPGILREDLHTQVTVTTNGGARVKVGPTDVAAHVARWQEYGWMLTSHSGKEIKQIPGKHFMASAMDEAAQPALDAFSDSLADSFSINTGDDEEIL